MPERRSQPRPDSPDRRTFPRPPLWLNLAILLLGVCGILLASFHRERVQESFSDVIASQERTPADLRRMKEELAEMDLTQNALKQELEGRLKLADQLKQEEFYLSIDTKQRKLRFHYAGTILREADLTIGEQRTIESREKTWTFIPVKGAFPIEAKIVGHDWRVPEWVYAMNGEPVPASRPVISNGLGRYVLFLPNGYVIHSPPPEESPLKGAKPGSYMVPADDLAAIWPRIHKDKTHVYIF
jgi:hypothetical protein